jgi:hypothetical protein
MTTWIVEYFPYVKSDPDSPELGHEIPCFRIFPEDDPERWIAQTNEELPPDNSDRFASGPPPEVRLRCDDRFGCGRDGGRSYTLGFAQCPASA